MIFVPGLDVVVVSAAAVGVADVVAVVWMVGDVVVVDNDVVVGVVFASVVVVSSLQLSARM